ncbi:hypothetical protein KD909_14995 (plasmid) [Exiguobacterium sp. PFWT01]|uniref:hypothetical protein n=1 Tax=Exiguobacterium sp. PFWT01 TaxID=2829816 RepID=UPI001BA939E4|nr:hypothetical protein [Exiguobacterium sp. PFWT01]QUP88734.1 hypothetical protein KD909_14995 [Exiguobacterium sp. PFWT01]
MRTTSYGIRVRPATSKRYGIQLSAAPVLSHQMYYGIKVDSRELIVASHPVTLPYYSIRSGHEEQQVRARRREREFSASLIAPEVLQLKEKDEVLADLMPYLEIGPAVDQVISLVDYDSARTTFVYPIELITAPVLSRRTRERSVSLDEIRSMSVQIEPREIAMAAELTASVNRNIQDVVEEQSTIMDRLTRHLVAVQSSVPILAMTTEVQHDAVLQEIEGMDMPMIETEETRFDAASRISITRIAEEQRKNEIERTTVPLETVEQKMEQQTKTNDPQETQQSAIHAVYHNDVAVEVAETDIQTGVYQERTYLVAEQKPLVASRDEIHEVDTESIHDASRRTNPELGSLDSIETLERLVNTYQTDEAAPAKAERDQVIHATVDEVLASDSTGRTEPVELSGMIQMGRTVLTRDVDIEGFSEGTTSGYVEDVQVTAITDGQRQAISTADLVVFLEGTTDGSSEMVALESVDETGAVTKDHLAFLEEMLDSDIPAYEVEEETFDAAERKMLTVEANMQDTTTIERSPSEGEATVIDLVTAHVERSYASILLEIDRAELERQHDIFMDEMDAMTIERMKEASLAVLDETNRHMDYLEAILDDIAYSQRGMAEAVYEDIDLVTRSVIHRLELMGHDELQTVAKDAILETHDEMGRTVKPAVMHEHHEAVRKERTFMANLEEFLDAIPWIKKKKKIWLIPSRANHWNPLSHWKKTR